MGRQRTLSAHHALREKEFARHKHVSMKFKGKIKWGAGDTKKPIAIFSSIKERGGDAKKFTTNRKRGIIVRALPFMPTERRSLSLFQPSYEEWERSKKCHVL